MFIVHRSYFIVWKHLDFIRNKKSWGFTFRSGFFEIAESDFKTIAQAMSAGETAE